MLCDDLKALRDKNHLTNIQLAEKTSIPPSSVSRIMSGETTNPSFQTVSALVIAMGESLDELTGIKAKPTVASDATISAYEKLVAEKDKIIASKEKWLNRLFTILCFIIAAILGLFTIDITNGNFGYFRY